MNIYVSVDNEGISGVYSREQTADRPGFVGDRRAEGRAHMTADINAVVEALKEAGADKIIVRDCHGRANTVLWDQLSPLADEYILGSTGQTRMPGVEDCDGVILLGYHAMAGTSQAIIDHTWSLSIQNLWLNGRRSGEIAMDAAVAGDHGVPVILITGDDKVCAEANEFFPWAVTAQVKRGMSNRGGIFLPRAKAHALLREKTIEAVKNISKMRVYALDKPVRLRVEITQGEVMPVARPDLKLIDERTYEVCGDTAEEAIARF